MIFYLLLLMYSRIFDTAGWIIFRTFILAGLILLTIIYCILIRDWRQLQVSRLRQRAIKEVKQQYGLSMSSPYRQQSIINDNRYYLPQHLQPTTINYHPQQHQQHPNHQYEQIDNIYSQIGPSTSSYPHCQQHPHRQQHHPPASRTSSNIRQTPGVVLTTYHN